MRRRSWFPALILSAWLACTAASLAVPPSAGKNSASSEKSAPPADGRMEGERVAASLRVPSSVQVSLFAAEPLVTNPVAFAFDERGRVYVVETFRLHHGVTDNRNHMNWLDADIACKTVEDRVAMYRKYLGAEFADYGKEEDRIRLVVDRDGDGKADTATIFADGFNHVEDGLASGVLARKGDVWFTCIPDLWKLCDQDGDGKADVRKSLHRGYGIHVAFLGHDLHGLRFGPDGKLYFSVGDRGLHIQTDGRTISNRDSGAILRCNPDGSELELFATGLRNPQELAFDKFGNLFSCDNNSDSGDKARCVYLVEGGDSGWRIGYQYLESPVSRGPWNAEKLWYPQWQGQAAYILPPLANIADGPSGFTYEPGQSLLPERYRHHFFLCDFRGSAGQSGVRSFALKPKGASFELVDSEKFLWGAEATDTDFGPDGALYVSDWVEGWNLTGKGRIYRVSGKGQTDPKALETATILGENLAQRSVESLVKLLSHADFRVRQEAQFALADLGDKAIAPLTDVAKSGKTLESRIHATWGLGQVGRRSSTAYASVIPLLSDSDAEVRAQAAKVLGDGRVKTSTKAMIQAVDDPHPRVRFFAAMGVGKLNDVAAIPPLLKLLREHGEQDPYLRHAAVMGLTGLHAVDRLLEAAQDPAPGVRLGVLLALRRLQSPEVARFLNDQVPAIEAEAARAIYDVPIERAFPQLAAKTGSNLSEPLLRRIINAGAGLGTAEQAERIASLAVRSDLPESIRVEAIEVLAEWPKPLGRDRVTGLWRPLPGRSAEVAAKALQQPLAEILKNAPEPVRLASLKALGALPIKSAGPILAEIVADAGLKNELRVEAIQALDRLGDSHLAEAVKRAVQDKTPALRVEGQRLLAKLEPEQALKVLEQVLERGTIAERQGAFSTLGRMPGQGTDQLLANWLDRLEAKQTPPEVALDLLEAVRNRPAPLVQERLKRIDAARSADGPLGLYRETLAGGDPQRGARILREKAEVSCLRCHKVEGKGGEVGPELTGIGGRQNREYLLASIVTPNASIAKGFETLVIARNDGQVVSGVLKEDDGQQLKLVDVNGKALTVPKSEIEEQKRGASAMPEDVVKHLSKSEIRDLIEYLAGLK